MKLKEIDFRSIYIAFMLLFVIMVAGILGFVLIEDYSFIEAFFMTIITVSTVGYQEVRQLSNVGMIFTSVLIIFSFGIFGYVITTITRYLVDGEFRQYYKNYKLNKKISSLNHHVIVCGYGRNGKQATQILLERNESVVVIEKAKEVIDEISGHPNLVYVHGDSTQEDVLEYAQLNKAEALITTLPSDADNLFVVLTAHEMRPDITIISRASDDHSDVKLKRAGATNVIMPDKVGGIHMAQLVAEPDIAEFIEAINLRSGNDVGLHELSCENLHPSFVNLTIEELDIRKESNVNLIGLKTIEGSYIFNPAPSIPLMTEDKLFVLGTPTQIEKLKNLLENGKRKRK